MKSREKNVIPRNCYDMKSKGSNSGVMKSDPTKSNVVSLRGVMSRGVMLSGVKSSGLKSSDVRRTVHRQW